MTLLNFRITRLATFLHFIMFDHVLDPDSWLSLSLDLGCWLFFVVRCSAKCMMGWIYVCMYCCCCCYCCHGRCCHGRSCHGHCCHGCSALVLSHPLLLWINLASRNHGDINNYKSCDAKLKVLQIVIFPSEFLSRLGSLEHQHQTNIPKNRFKFLSVNFEELCLHGSLSSLWLQRLTWRYFDILIIFILVWEWLSCLYSSLEHDTPSPQISPIHLHIALSTYLTELRPTSLT